MFCVLAKHLTPSAAQQWNGVLGSLLYFLAAVWCIVRTMAHRVKTRESQECVCVCVCTCVCVCVCAYILHVIMSFGSLVAMEILHFN